MCGSRHERRRTTSSWPPGSASCSAMAEMPGWLTGLASRVELVDATSALAAQSELDRKTKPRASLGRLETLAVQIAAARRSLSLESLPVAVLVAAADHGYAAAGVSAYPQEVTR